jgi:outer membrane protein assembly factor BamB
LESSTTRQSRRVIAGDWALPQLIGESGDAAVGEVAGPLSQFVYQNAAQGLISSDGRHVFYVEDDAILTLGRTNMRNGAGIDETPEPGSETANRLTACNLQTGRTAWQVGGPESTDPLNNSLSGLFFMGAPLPVGNDLFVVAMKGRDVRLYCLDSETGSARWSQLLAFADHQPDRDLVRRIWSAQPSFAHGVVVCPTHVGWLVAVDRSTGTLLWAHRYTQRKRRLQTPSFDPFAVSGLPSTASEPINSRWVTSAPIIVGRRVFVTPAESKNQDDPSSSVIACLDLFTGQRIWQKARGKGRYLAGVSDGRAIVVENDAVVAYGLKGKREWDTDLPRDVGAPSGRGVITDNSLWLPTQKSSLLRIDLTDGKIAARLTLPETGRPLGNLAMYRGMLISHHPSELQAFEQTTVLEQRLSAARSQGRHDPATALLDARLALARGEFDRAMNVLKDGLAASSDPQIRTQLRSLLAQAILKNLESSPSASLSLVRELEKLAGSAEESLRHEQLAIEVLLRTGHPDEALAILIERDTHETMPLVNMLSDPSVTSSLFAWMEERLTLAWSQLSPPQRRTAGAAIATRLNETGVSDLILERRARLYAFHPAASLLQSELADQAIEQKQLARASHWLGRMTESSDPEVAARALTQQIELDLQNFVDRSELESNIARAERLATRFSLEAPFTTRLSELRRRFEARAAEYRSSEEEQWPISEQLRVTLTRSGGSHSKQTTFGIDPVDGDSPAGSRYRIQVSGNGNARRLSLIERRNGDLAWSVVMRGNSGGGRNLSVRRAGPMLLVLHRGVLNCLSIPDRRVLWARTVDMPDAPLKFPKVKPVKLQPGTDWGNRLAAGANDPLPIVNSSYVCSRGRKSLSVFDTLSGELLWQLDPAPRTVRVHATSSMICLVRRNGQVAAAYDARSGRRLKDAPKQLHAPLALIGDQTVTANMDDAGEKITVESKSLDADAPAWSHEFEAEHRFGMVGRNRLAIMRNRGMFAVLDLQTGALQSFERIPASLRIGKSNFSVLRDESRWYVILNGEAERDYQAPSLRSALISGHLLAFDATTGKQLWRQSLSDQYLILDQLSSSPFLVMLRPSSNPLGIPNESLRLMLLRKSDGNPLLDQSLPGSISIHSMRLDRQSRSVELLASGDRIRLNVEPVEEP